MLVGVLSVDGVGSGGSFLAFAGNMSNLFWLENRGGLSLGKGLEQSMEGVNFQFKQLAKIREGGGGDEGKDMSCILGILKGTVLSSAIFLSQ